MKKEIKIRKAEINDLSRIAEIQVFNYRLYFYPIFKSDEYYFDELCVPSLMQKYEAGLDSRPGFRRKEIHQLPGQQILPCTNSDSRLAVFSHQIQEA